MGWSGQNNTSGAASVTQSRKAELTSLANIWLRIQQLLKSLYTQHQYEGGAIRQSICSKPFEVLNQLTLPSTGKTSLHRIPENIDVLRLTSIELWFIWFHRQSENKKAG